MILLPQGVLDSADTLRVITPLSLLRSRYWVNYALRFVILIVYILSEEFHYYTSFSIIIKPIIFIFGYRNRFYISFDTRRTFWRRSRIFRRCCKKESMKHTRNMIDIYQRLFHRRFLFLALMCTLDCLHLLF
jgi:hypothetical protein